MNNTPVTPNFQLSPTFVNGHYFNTSSSNLADLTQYQDFNDSLSLFPRQIFSLSRNPSTTELLQYQTNQLMQLSPQPIPQPVIRQTPQTKKKRTKEESKETHKAIERRRTTTIKNLILEIKKELEEKRGKLPKSDKVSILQTAYSHILDCLNKIKDNDPQPSTTVDNNNTAIDSSNNIENEKMKNEHNENQATTKQKLREKHIQRKIKRQMQQQQQQQQENQQQQQQSLSSKVYTLHITKSIKYKQKIHQRHLLNNNQQQSSSNIPPQLQLQSFHTSLQQQQQIPPPPLPLPIPNNNNNNNNTQQDNNLQQFIHSISITNNNNNNNNSLPSISPLHTPPIISKPIPHTPIPQNNSYENMSSILPYATPFDPSLLTINFPPSSPPAASYLLGTSPSDSIRTPGTTAFSDFNDFNNSNNK